MAFASHESGAIANKFVTVISSENYIKFKLNLINFVVKFKFCGFWQSAILGRALNHVKTRSNCPSWWKSYRESQELSHLPSTSNRIAKRQLQRHTVIWTNYLVFLQIWSRR